jgi:hypothetical protein
LEAINLNNKGDYIMKVKFNIKHNNIQAEIYFNGYGSSIEEAMCEGLRKYLQQEEGSMELGEVVTIQSIEIES